MRTIFSCRVNKRKSIQQIREQAARLAQEMQRRSGRSTSTTKAVNRISRIGEIAERYIRNIAQSRRFANDVNNGKGIDVARGRRYSQNTYMGINAG